MIIDVANTLKKYEIRKASNPIMDLKPFIVMIAYNLSNAHFALSYLASWLNLAQERGNVEAAIEVNSRENHTLTLNAHHFARSKVCHEEYVLADELLWLVVSGDA